jgi:hypothetical protein
MAKGKKKEKIKKQKTSSVFELSINNFTNNVECLNFSIPIIMGSLVQKRKISRNKFDIFLSKKTKKGKNNSFSVKLEDSQQFELLDKELRNSYLAIRTVPRSLLISLVSFFDNYLRELLKIVFQKNQYLLKNTEKKISASEILEIEDFNEAKNYLVNREIEALLYEGRFRCLDWLEEKLKIKFDFDQSLKIKFIEISERRNLFVHSDGIITKQYLNACKKSNIEVDKKLKVGHQLTVTPEYFNMACLVVYSIGVEFGQVLWRKIEPDNLEEIDASLLNMTAELIENGNNFTAGKLLDFTEKFDKFSSDQLKRMLTINRALAMKFGKAQDKANKLIDSVDWSSSDKEFKLAVAIIKNNLKEATNIMIEMGPTDKMKMAYKKEWPLFKEFKKTALFRKTYKEIFKESFIIREEKFEDDKKLETH